jgi:hypothetical protein
LTRTYGIYFREASPGAISRHQPLQYQSGVRRVGSTATLPHPGEASFVSLR